VLGTLNYNFYGKHKNSGTIKGSLHNDLVIVDYTFMAEGTTSVREIKLENGKLIEACGRVPENMDRKNLETTVN